MVCMMKIFPNMQTLVFLVVVHIPVSCLATGVLRSSFWSALTSRRMTSHQAAVSSRSAAECIRECKKYSFCNRVAFQRWNATCYLLPSTRIGQTAADVDVIIYADKAPICAYDEAPITNATVTWRHALTSVEGDVTCWSGYTWTTDDVTVKCGVNNSWTVGGQCSQTFWINPSLSTKYDIPRTPRVGWKICVTGTPHANAEHVSVNFFDTNNERPLKVKFRFVEIGVPQYNTKFLSYLNDTFINQQIITSPPFPMKESSPFLLAINASSETVMDVYVNNTFYFSHPIPVSVTTITKIQIFGQVDQPTLDLWCT